ncbi:AMP-binding protein [Frigoriglobus tundricola]|uniref:AMP-dependent synthetase/ligase in alkane synthesis cluster n=1 Tax=Frigoriglobus tundricola TaxID=2774151 RepID=A0A6M5YL42_9BACT|nr:AMP-binding protein [Frigoriglobus tundricola]QJW94006.1 AMP-dependent synthetase/ligase in alkane synthesis cluster [Frigoriglobus tundricola]
MPSLNVASHLARMAAAHPAQVAVHAPRGRVSPDGPTGHRAITFAELNADADAIAHGLHAAGIGRGTRTALMVPPSPDFFALTFALFKVGAVPVLIDPGMGVRNLGTCLAEAGPDAFVGIAKAHAARRVLGWAKRTVRTTVNVGRWRFACDTSLARLRAAGRGRGAYPIPEPTADESAAVLFTSGSTGPAKGVVYTHGIFAAQVELLKSTYGIAPGEIDLCTFPLFALFGPALGMTCVIPDMDASRPARIDPRKAVAQIRQFGVTNLFGSPAVIRRLGEMAEEPTPPSPLPKGKGGEDLRNSVAPAESGGASRAVTPFPSGRGAGGGGPLSTLRRVISAGAAASAASIERFVRLLPDGVEVFTPYGATEALPVANIGSREILAETRFLTEQGRGVCVGRPVGGVEVRVIRISDEPIAEWADSLLAPPGEVGEFVVRGPVVTRQYYNRPDATKLAKIHDPITGDVYHRMGDVGYLDDRGRLWFCGRKSHRVVTPHGTLFTDMVEPIFNTVPGVARTALVGVRRSGVMHPVICVEFDGPITPRAKSGRFSALEPRLRETGRRGNQTRGITTFLEHPKFPVDVRHNSKIFREKLAVWADEQLGPKWTPEVEA